MAMKYECGHLGCDICGARACANVPLHRFYGYLVDTLSRSSTTTLFKVNHAAAKLL